MTSTHPAPAPVVRPWVTGGGAFARRHGPSLLAAAAVLLGVGLRTAAFAADRPLWIDEAMLALNLTDRSVGQLFEPLDRDQAAPVGFLLAGHLCVTLFGPTEHALRLPAFAGSVAGMGLFAVAAFCLLPPWSARLAVLLFAVSPTVVSYAAEVKQYSTDAAVAAGLLALVAPALSELTRGRLVWLAVGGAVAVWLSHPAAFVLAGAGVVLFVRSLAHRRWRWAVPLVAVAWAGNFAGVYAVNVRFASSNPQLAAYWAEDFLPRSPAAGPWLVERGIDLFRRAGGYGGTLQATGFAAVLAAAGAFALGRDGRTAELGVLLGGFGVTLLAAAAHKYPFAGRLLLFLMPTAVLLLAHGAAAVAGAVWGRSKAGAVVLLAAVVAAPAAEVGHQFRFPDRREDVPAAVRFVRERWQPGDRLYVYNGGGDVGAGPAFAFYTRGRPFPPGAVTLGGTHRDDPHGYRAEVKELADTPGRVWVLFAHQHADDEVWVRAYFDEVGERDDSFRDPVPGTGPRAAVFGYRVR